jgi:pimeloyl-ACP methyl ester carboxylesterase
VFTCGSTQSPPLMLLHGGNFNSAMWLRSLPVWSAHFRIYVVDTIGDPGLSATTRPSLRTDDHALWLDDVYAALDLASASIVGASFGGWLGLDYALRRPQAVNRLVLLAPAGIARVSMSATLGISALMLMGAWGRRQALLRLLGLVDAGLTAEQRSFLAFSGVVQLNALSRIRVPSPIADGRMRTLSARTLAVLGGKDIMFDSSAVRDRLQQLCPTATVRTLPDAGHGLVDPTSLVQEFLHQH